MLIFRYEVSLGRNEGAVICGVDEAGRGPLAGPVVVCAATLPLTGIWTRLLGARDDPLRHLSCRELSVRDRAVSISVFLALR